jgi:predicted  nucleic acid-binding Zn-ribbon protein
LDKNWLELVIAFVAGGGIQAILNHFIANKSSKRDDFEKIIETWEEDNNRLRKENQDLRNEITNLQNQINVLRARVLHLEEKEN